MQQVFQTLAHLYLECNTCYKQIVRLNSWLLFIHQVPARPSTLRVGTWRKLKALGAAYLQQSLCILPNKPNLRKALDHLKTEIESSKGQVTISAIRMESTSEHRDLIKRFQGQSDEEYREFLGQCRDFHQELEQERAHGHFTFAELDENEAELAKLRSWLPKIIVRDFFGAQLQEKARRALAACERNFERFAKEVERRQPELRQRRR